MARPLCAGCSSRPAEVGESKLCTVCSGWKQEVDDLAAVNAHHVDERNHTQEILQAVRDYANEMGDANRVRLRLLDILGDDTTEERKRIGFRESTEPKHLPSLGPDPTTVAEWVKMTEETGILEFPLLLEIAGKLEAKLTEAQALLAGKSKECEDAWKHQRYWEEEATKARRAADDWRVAAVGRKDQP